MNSAIGKKYKLSKDDKTTCIAVRPTTLLDKNAATQIILNAAISNFWRFFIIKGFG